MQEDRSPPVNDEGQSSSENGLQALQVHPRKLKVEDELRRIFGSKFINSGRHDEDEGALLNTHAPQFTSGLTGFSPRMC